MKRGYLSEFFRGAVAKRLSRVEVERTASNQHEFNGNRDLTRLLGKPPPSGQNLDAAFVYLSDAAEPRVALGQVTWYDAREAHPTRTENRLYYPANSVTELMAEGDLLALALRQDGTLLAIVAQGGSSSESQVEWLFGLGATTQSFSLLPEQELDSHVLELSARQILELIGVEDAVPLDNDSLGLMLRRFGGIFPTTKEFSALARETANAPVLRQSVADEVLMAWLEREEVLFRTLEKYLVEQRLSAGFDDVDVFMAFSLSVHNRRKARAGSAFENHLQEIFDRLAIEYTRAGVTERRSKPDFIFPGIANYRDESFPSDRLTMLAAKSTCKDRWRQVTREADRIPHKHLVTLEPAISENQLDEMMHAGVALVIPRQVQSTYQANRRAQLITLERLLELVRDRQCRSGRPTIVDSA